MYVARSFAVETMPGQEVNTRIPQSLKVPIQLSIPNRKTVIDCIALRVIFVANHIQVYDILAGKRSEFTQPRLDDPSSS